MIKYIKNGNIFDSECEVLVNPVNCVGVMGGGLAKEFKRRYPEMFLEYVKWCNLDWENVKLEIEKHLKDFDGLVEVYEPLSFP